MKVSGLTTPRSALFCLDDPTFLLATPFRVVRLEDQDAVAAATHWWETLTSAGGEGMVIKPLDFVCEGTRGLMQLGVKCRGSEYRRIIYGPEYALPEH